MAESRQSQQPPAQVAKDLLQVPFPDMVKAIATGIVEAQFALDMMSLRIAKVMSGADSNDRVRFDGKDVSLLELGFTPTFYQFVDTIIEIKMSISMSTEQSADRKTVDVDAHAGYEGHMGFLNVRGTASLQVSTVSASFASKFQYSAEGSSLMRTKLVPVPPPAVLERRLRQMADKPRAGT